MNPLTGALPTTVEVGGVSVPIRTSHRVGIAFEELVARHLPDSLKLLKALDLYYEDIPADTVGAVEQMLWFYRLGKDPQDAVGPRVYDFAYDFDSIYASFRQAYSVDLFRDDLHWWEFRAMLLGLPDDSPFMAAVGYRQMKIPAGASPEQRDFYGKMKRLHALPSEERRLTVEEVYRAKFGHDLGAPLP